MISKIQFMNDLANNRRKATELIVSLFLLTPSVTEYLEEDFDFQYEEMVNSFMNKEDEKLLQMAYSLGVIE